MKKLIMGMALIGLLPLSAQAKDICIRYDNGNPTYVAYYKFKKMPVPIGGSVRLSGVVVFPSLDLVWNPSYAEGSAMGLPDGTINFYLTPISYKGNAVIDTLYARGANKKTYIGTLNGDLSSFIDCADFPKELLVNPI